ncbi:IS110 family transposase [Acanthopleuribacter pedis]
MTQQITAWCGIDVSKATFDAAFLCNESSDHIRRIPVKNFRNDGIGVRSFLAWLKRLEANTKIPLQGVRVVMEATGRYSTKLFDRLMEKRPELRPAIINSAAAAKHRESFHLKHKNDSLDARALSYFGREREPREYEAPSPRLLEISQLVKLRRSMVDERARWKLRLQASLLQPEASRIEQVIAFKTAMIEDTEAEIRRLIGEERDLSADHKLLMSIPGVGFLTAAIVLSIAGDLRRFRTGRQCASWAGVSPKERQSGTSVRKKTRMSKAGNSFLRKTLYMASLAAIRNKKSLFREMYDRLRSNNKTAKQALGAVMRKMILVMRSILISGEPYRFSNESSKELPAAS